jgi:hypothetical protein
MTGCQRRSAPPHALLRREGVVLVIGSGIASSARARPARSSRATTNNFESDTLQRFANVLVRGRGGALSSGASRAPGRSGASVGRRSEDQLARALAHRAKRCAPARSAALEAGAAERPRCLPEPPGRSPADLGGPAPQASSLPSRSFAGTSGSAASTRAKAPRRGAPQRHRAVHPSRQRPPTSAPASDRASPTTSPGNAAAGSRPRARLRKSGKSRSSSRPAAERRVKGAGGVARAAARRAPSVAGR